jgi:phosphoribosylaminoimidazolecarboxamide formyltransferase / IMP cyclohydrolase
MIRAVKKIDNLVPVKNVMISVTDKSYLDVLVVGIIESCPGVIIYSSGGTYKAIAGILGPEKAQFHLREVSQYTGQAETEGGLVKTLHHKLFLGYLTETHCTSHQEDLRREDAVQIDLLVINLYPFAKTVEGDGVTIEDARGNIDVGGPSALRAAAKNWHRVATLPLASLDDYQHFLKKLRANKGCTDLRDRFSGWKKTFSVLSSYDSDIYEYLVKKANFLDIEKVYEIK